MWWQIIGDQIFIWGWQEAEQLISSSFVDYATGEEKEREVGTDFTLNASNVMILYRIVECVRYEGELVTYRVQRLDYKYPSSYEVRK